MVACSIFRVPTPLVEKKSIALIIFLSGGIIQCGCFLNAMGCSSLDQPVQPHFICASQHRSQIDSLPFPKMVYKSLVQNFQGIHVQCFNTKFRVRIKKKIQQDKNCDKVPLKRKQVSMECIVNQIGIGKTSDHASYMEVLNPYRPHP